MSRSGIVQPDIYSYNSPNPIFVYGEALLSGGLSNRQATNGLGVVTRGLLWQLYDIYIDTEFIAPITTTWTNSDAVITTTWTSPQYGMWGDYIP